MIQRKNIVRLTVLVVAGLLALITYLFSAIFDTTNTEEGARQLAIGETSYELLVADTPAQQIQGLSGHPGLKENEGMLFIFSDSEERSFWMKDMNFPLDIIWIDETKRVAGFVENATPESFPEMFNSEVPVQYVLEVNAGDVAKKGIEVGDTVIFE